MASVPIVGTLSWTNILLGMLLGIFVWPMIRGFIPSFGVAATMNNG